MIKTLVCTIYFDIKDQFIKYCSETNMTKMIQKLKENATQLTKHESKSTFLNNLNSLVFKSDWFKETDYDKCSSCGHINDIMNDKRIHDKDD